MAHRPAQPFQVSPKGPLTLAALGASLLLSACAGSSDLLPSSPYLASSETQADTSKDPAAELRAATDYWGKQYQAKPGDKTAALSYAKNLKASGEKRQALQVLQEAASAHSSDTELMGELGRLALEFDQLTTAQRALEIAERSDKPDWRVLSARGTVLAKQGQHKAAIPYFERALTLSPAQPSVMNNLAMAHAMSGDAAKAEEILRQAASATGASPKVNQNLALVLGLQGKYEESKAAGTLAAGSSTIAAENTEYLRRMVKLAPQGAPAAATNVAQTSPAARETMANAGAGTPASSAKTPNGLPWTTKTEPSRAAQANDALANGATANDAFKPGSMDNTSTADKWQTAVSANAEAAPTTHRQ